jgi:hypothetical protein
MPFDLETRNQVLLERLKTGASREFNSIIKKINTRLGNLFGGQDEFIASKKDMRELQREVAKVVGSQVTGHYKTSLNPLLQELSVDQAAFESEVIGSKGHVKKSRLVSYYENAPMSLTQGKKLFLKPFLDDFRDYAGVITSNDVVRGFAQKIPTVKILAAIKGRRKFRFRDGSLSKVSRGYANTASTAIQHVATSSRHRIMSLHPDIEKYRWISVLDSRTSSICRGLSGREFDIGKGPLPPAHWGCRSSTMVLRGNSPPPDHTYYSWLQEQPRAFQDAAIGPSRAKLLRDGGLTSEGFAKLSLNTSFQPLTLEEMRAVNPTVFNRAKLVIK